jgi:hypothetical protein
MRVGLALIPVAAVAFAFGLRSGDDPRDAASTTTDTRLAELPRGGVEILPARRVVAFYGAPQDPELGVLGIGSPGRAAARLLEQAEPYDRKNRPVLPALELISTVANADPGIDGAYSSHQPDGVIERYLAAARDAKALLVLDVQPGRRDFLDEARRLEQFLEQPDVGLALDPEWHVGPGEVPGEVIGSVSARTVNQVSAYLARIVAEGNLPQKLLIVHQFTAGMIANRDKLEPRPGVAIVLNSDGFGDQPNKIAKYDQLRPAGTLAAFHPGFKLFYGEDVGLMSPEQVLDLKPPPAVVIYE